MPTTRSFDYYRQAFQSVNSADSLVGNLGWTSLAANSSGTTCCEKLERQLGNSDFSKDQDKFDPLCQAFSRVTPRHSCTAAPAAHQKGKGEKRKKADHSSSYMKRVTISIKLRSLNASCAALYARLSEDSHSYSTRITLVTSHLGSDLCRRCIH